MKISAYKALAVGKIMEVMNTALSTKWDLASTHLKLHEGKYHST